MSAELFSRSWGRLASLSEGERELVLLCVREAGVIDSEQMRRAFEDKDWSDYGRFERRFDLELARVLDYLLGDYPESALAAFSPTPELDAEELPF
jgi:hypothetical protein